MTKKKKYKATEFINLQHAYTETEDFPYLLQRVVKDTLFKSYNEQEVNYPKIVKGVKSDGAFETYAGVIGNLHLAPLHKLEEYPDAGMSEEHLTIYNHKYGRVISFATEDIEDDNRGIFRDLPGKYGKYFRLSIEKSVLDVVCDAANYSAARGNLVQTSLALSYDGIIEAYDLFTMQRGPDGEFINVFPDTLLMHPTQMWKIPEIFAPTRTVLTQPTRGATAETKGSQVIANPLANRFNFLFSPYVPNADTWYLFKAKDGMKYQKRTNLEITTTTKTSQQTFSRDAYAVKARARWGIGMDDYRFHTYSPGK